MVSANPVCVPPVNVTAGVPLDAVSNVLPVTASAFDPIVAPLSARDVPVAAPKTGVTNVGVVDSTVLPDPVDVVTPVPPLATGKVPETCVVKLTLPVNPDVGNPVQLVNVPLVGVPKIGVTKVGEVDSTTLPEPVDVTTPVPPLATAKVPVTPVDNGKPVALVSVRAVGVPRLGVTNVGEVARTALPDPVVVSSPAIPALSYRTLPDVPPVIEVTPMLIPEPPPPPPIAAHDTPLQPYRPPSVV